MSLSKHLFYPAPERGRRALTARSGLAIPSGPCASFRAPPGRAVDDLTEPKDNCAQHGTVKGARRVAAYFGLVEIQPVGAMKNRKVSHKRVRQKATGCLYNLPVPVLADRESCATWRLCHERADSEREHESNSLGGQSNLSAWRNAKTHGTTHREVCAG